MKNHKFGTREWATVTKNILNGCNHSCKYCYSKYNTCYRWKRMKPEEWSKHKLDEKKLKEKPKRVEGRIMFPTQHDIFPEFIDETVEYLRGWLSVGNDILIVSKPHLTCIKEICNNLDEYKEQIVFRFTVGSKNNNVLNFWEPNAPDYDERKKSLLYAYDKGWQTSVSSEPYLDESIKPLVYELLHFITDTIWIGKMNFIEQRVDTNCWSQADFVYLERLKRVITDSFVKELYFGFNNDVGFSDDIKQRIRWKESCKKVLGLEDEPIG